MSEKITLQMIFDKAWQAFVVEDRPPAVVNEYCTETCMYLTEDGQRCAIGLALPDSVAEELKGKIVAFGELVHRFEHYRHLFDTSVSQLSVFELDKFQRDLHDEMQDKGFWTFSINERRERYKEVAEEYGLTIPGEPDE